MRSWRRTSLLIFLALLFACILLVLSFGMGFPVVLEYFHTGLVPRFPTLIVSSILLVLSIVLWITGIILEVIAKKHKQI